MTESVAIREERNSKTTYGFWVYLMTDCVLFAALFATYIVLHNNTDGGDGSKTLFNLPYALTETMILLTSSFTCGLAMLAGQRRDRKQVALWLIVTFLFGLAFLTLELNEFHHLHHDGNGWERSAFLSGFFTLVGTHGLHISVGLLWVLVFLPNLLKKGMTDTNTRRLAMFGMFWHFLDLVWIFIFSIVYLVGAL